MVETLAPKTPKYQQDDRILKARVALAAKLGVPPDDVTITIGREKAPESTYHYASSGEIMSGDSPNTEEVSITIHKPGFDLEQDRVREEIRATLAQLAPLADVAQMVPEVKLATKLKKDLLEATAGTNFKQEYLKWPGFDEEMHKKGISIPDHAVEDVRSKAYGVELNLRFPSDDKGDQAAAMQKFAELTRGRTEAIKGILLDRVLKYNAENITARGLNEQEAQAAVAAGQATGKSPDEAKAQALVDKIRASEDKIRADFAKLKINVVTHRNRLEVEIRSPEQEAAYKKAEESAQGSWKDPDNADELRNTNPLTSLIVGLTTQPVPATDTKPEQAPQLHKALARSILFDKDKNPIPDFVKVAGRKDIQIAIAKEMMRILPQHPDKEPKFREILNSQLFKEHELWHGSEIGKADVAKPYPQFEKVAGENDTVKLTLSVHKDADPSKNKVKQLIEGLASLSATAAPAPAPQPQAPTAPQAQQQAPAAPQPQATAEAGGDVYKDIARRIIEAHKAQQHANWQSRTEPPSTPGTARGV